MCLINFDITKIAGLYAPIMRSKKKAALSRHYLLFTIHCPLLLLQRITYRNTIGPWITQYSGIMSRIARGRQ